MRVGGTCSAIACHKACSLSGHFAEGDIKGGKMQAVAVKVD